VEQSAAHRAGAGALSGPVGETPALAASLLRLVRPAQWSKSAFVLLGPVYAAAEGKPVDWPGVLGAVLAITLASSSAYVVNDIHDRRGDLAHPRKRNRPVAAGAVTVAQARTLVVALLLGALGALFLVGTGPAADARAWGWPARPLVALTVVLYLANTTAYSIWLKHVAIVDVMSLAAGFVLRVLAGCAAAGVSPSTWLLNCTLFLAMFLAFGKRLGERRTLAALDADSGSGVTAARARRVHLHYTDELLRMAVVVTAVATLITYAGYVQAREAAWTVGMNLLWLTVLPPTYAMFRCILLLERGRYDDPTELAARDRPFQVAAAAFVVLTAGLMLFFRRSGGG